MKHRTLSIMLIAIAVIGFSAMAYAQSRLAADFTGYGLYLYDGNKWDRLGASPADMEAWRNGFVFSYSGYGLYLYENGKWTWLSASPKQMEVWKDSLALDFSGYGLYLYDGSTWKWVCGSPQNMVEYGSKLALDFSGYGLYLYDGSTLNWLCGSPRNMVEWGNKLVLDFSGYGIYLYDGTWKWLCASARNMTEWGDKLALDFAGYGLYIYDGNKWTWIGGSPEGMTTWENKLVLDYGAYGLYTYDGSWAQLSGANPTKMAAMTAQSSSTEYFTGNQSFKQEEGERSDNLFGFRASAPVSYLLPSTVDYTYEMPVVKSQGSVGSCTAWANGYYLKTWQEALEEGWDRNTNAFSPMYLFAMQCKYNAFPWDMLVAWETMNRFGCAKFSTVPYVDYKTECADPYERNTYAAVNISDAANTEAMGFRCGEKNQLTDLNQVKQALTSSPVLLGINYYDPKLESPSPENNYLKYSPYNSDMGHAILCIGYDDTKFGTGAIKFINSWGQQWGVNGFSWIRYSDYNNIVKFAMTVKDITNASTPFDTRTKPNAPSDVSASDNTGPYVDITWTKVTGANYYRIYRAKVGDSTTYAELGTSYGVTYRDFPEPGIVFYYSVISVNDIGESDHRASDTDTKGYVDKGSAKGNKLSKPVLSWLSNDNSKISSNFKVSNIDPAATSMQVFVSTTSAGPWYSFGWIYPGDFDITWGEDSEYVGKKPFVKVIMENSYGYSDASEPVQVGQTIVSSISVAAITTITAVAGNDYITVSWTTDAGEADFFEVWRYLAAEDFAEDWVLLGYATGTKRSYTDNSALPGKQYYYAVCATYQGTYGEFAITDEPVQTIVSGTNLYLYSFSYSSGQIVSPAYFEIDVWNDGGKSVSDYQIGVWAYDWNEDNIYQMADIFYASDIAEAGQLPLLPGDYHTLSFWLNINPAFADGHFYSWFIEIDPNNLITEEYEDDNYLMEFDGWWMTGSARKLLYSKDPSGVISKGRIPSDVKLGNTRPFSKERISKSTRQEKEIVGKIRFKKPPFCINHSE